MRTPTTPLHYAKERWCDYPKPHSKLNTLKYFQKWQQDKKHKLTVDKSLDFIGTQVYNCQRGLIDYEDMVKALIEHLQEVEK